MTELAAGFLLRLTAVRGNTGRCRCVQWRREGGGGAKEASAPGGTVQGAAFGGAKYKILKTWRTVHSPVTIMPSL